MGLYINPPGTTKEQWLINNAVGVQIPELAWSMHENDPEVIVVCLVNNVMFTAAGVAYNRNEFDTFNTPDGRSKEWWVVPKEKIKEICPDYRYYFKDKT